MNAILKSLRETGWTVAVHNDYWKDVGPSAVPSRSLFTFWLITHVTGVFTKAEGLAIDEEKVLEELQGKAEKLVRLGAVEGTLGRYENPSAEAVAASEAAQEEHGLYTTKSVPEKLGVHVPPASTRALADSCAAKIVRGGKQLAPDRWDEKNMLTYFGCLLQHVRQGRKPETRFAPKDRMNMRRLVAWLKPKETKRLIEFVVFNWTELARRYSIRGFPIVSVLYGFRQTFVEAMDKGIGEAPVSRTHRSEWSDEDAPAKPQRIFG